MRQRTLCTHPREKKALEGVARVIFGLKTFAKCGAISADENNGIITSLATFVIACFTATLWRATNALVRTERDKRSAVGGGGEKARGGSVSVFTIIATNAGPGSAVLRRLRWGFGDLGTLPPTPVYAQDIQTGEPLFPGQKQPVRHARMFTEGYRNPVIFFRFDYYDINRRREASAGFVLIIDSPDFPALSIPTVDVPPAYLADNFPLGT
jgi:hypothetical protein